MSAARVTLRRGGVSLRAGVRPLAVAAALSAAALGALLASVSLGELAISPLDVIRGDGAARFVVLELRLPRAVTGLLAGAALGVAGAVFQDVTRNPLVAPDIVGVAGGASLAAAAVIVYAPPGDAAPLAALAGALAAGALLYALAWRGGVSGQRLVLAGIGVAAFANAGVGYVLTQGRIFEVARAYVWLVGSLNAAGWNHAWPLAVAVAVLVPALLALGRRIDALALGDDAARALGLGVERTRLLALGGATVLTAAAVAAAGPVAFVAFVAPHIARRLARPASAQSLLLVAAATGAALVVLADLAGRLAFAPTEIPAGIVTSVLAAPYFLYLLRK